jgi:hypothetical protein
MDRRTLTLEEEDILADLATSFVWEVIQAEGWPTNCCIGACRVLQEVLRDSGISAKPLVVETTVVNAAALAEVARLGRQPTSPAEIESAIQAGWYTVEIGTAEPGEAPGGPWRGHVVLLTDRLLLDPSLPQASRPARGIELVPLVAEHAGVLPRQPLQMTMADCALAIVPRPRDRAFVSAPDWQLSRFQRAVAAKVIPAVRAVKVTMLTSFARGPVEA